VVQSCHKGAPDGPVKLWKAKATVADPGVNSKFRMAFFGGLVTQEYNVLEHRADQGWLILGTADGKYMWLMSQRPTLPARSERRPWRGSGSWASIRRGWSFRSRRGCSLRDRLDRPRRGPVRSAQPDHLRLAQTVELAPAYICPSAQMKGSPGRGIGCTSSLRA
jgi:hypothetical protein